MQERVTVISWVTSVKEVVYFFSLEFVTMYEGTLKTCRMRRPPPTVVREHYQQDQISLYVFPLKGESTFLPIDSYLGLLPTGLCLSLKVTVPSLMKKTYCNFQKGF